MTDTINTHEEDFEQIVRDAGIPTTAEEMQDEWDKINEDQGSLIKNDSAWSPFWKLISAIVTTPSLWVVQFLINNLLPNSFIKTAEDTFLDILAWSLKQKRRDGVATIGNITFTRLNVQNAMTVPRGTRIQSSPVNGIVYELMTMEDTAFPDNEITVDIPSEAVNTGADYNLAPGYYHILPEPIDGIVSVRNNDEWIITTGANQETNDELRLRCRNQFTAVGQFHHDAAYKAIIHEFSGLREDFIWFEHGAPRGSGSANAYLMIETGAAPEELVSDINRHIRISGYHGHGDDMECFSMAETEYSFTMTIYPAKNLTSAQLGNLKHSCEQMVRSAFRENLAYPVTRTWPFNRFSMSRLGQELHDYLPDLDSVAFDRGDIESLMDLPVIGTLTINVNTITRAYV